MEEKSVIDNFSRNLEKNLQLNRAIRKKSLRNVSKSDNSRIKELERKLENLEKTNSFLIQTAEDLRAADKEKIKDLLEKNQNLLEELEKTKSDASNVHNNVIENCSQCSKNVEEMENMRVANRQLEIELGQCTEEIEELKDTIARKEKESSKSTNDLNRKRSTDDQQLGMVTTEKEKKIIDAPTATLDTENKKYIVVGDNWSINIWKDTVELINVHNITNLNNLSQDISFYPKEMFILVKDSLWVDKLDILCANLLLICQSWKELRPDGEIHVIASTDISSSAIYPTKIKSLFTTFNTFITGPNSFFISPVDAICRHWPTYADQLLLPKYIT